MSGWTTEAVATLRNMVRAGRSANDIAVEIGFSRSAVIGKATRLGLKLHGQNGKPRSSAPSAGTTPAPPARKASQPLPGNIRSKKEAMKGDAGLDVPITSEDARHYDAAARAVPLSTVKLSGECKFPVNNAGPGETHLFCGQAASSGSWCEHHRRRVYGEGTRSERRADEMLRKAVAR